MPRLYNFPVAEKCVACALAAYQVLPTLGLGVGRATNDYAEEDGSLSTSLTGTQTEVMSATTTSMSSSPVPMPALSPALPHQQRVFDDSRLRWGGGKPPGRPCPLAAPAPSVTCLGHGGLLLQPND